MKEIEPKIKVPNIELEIDTYNVDGANYIMNAFGPIIPVVKFGDYTLGAGELRDLTINVSLNKLPRIDMTIIDTSFRIRKILSDSKVDTAVIFVGNPEWYQKFEVLILNVNSDAGDEEVTITACLHIPKLYETFQKTFSKQSVKDILKYVCSNCDIGLFTCDNSKLTFEFDNLNPGMQSFEYIDYLMSQFTDNIWCFDTFYYMHAGTYDSIIKQPIDSYYYKNNKKFDNPEPIIITTRRNNTLDDDKKLNATYYTINSNIGNIHQSSHAVYNLKSVNNEKLLDNVNLGTGTKSNNTFDRFIDRYNPNYKEIVNKQISGKSIVLEMDDILLEIIPFLVVDVEIFLPKDGTNNKFNEKDVENSGKKMIIGYTMQYLIPGDESRYPRIKQTIVVI